jgi:integrase
MGRKKTAGLFKKRNIWQIDKQIFGRRLRGSTGTSNLVEAGLILVRKIEMLRQEVFFGAKPQHLYQEAKSRYLDEKQTKISISEDIRALNHLSEYFHDKPLEQIHMGSLQPYMKKRRCEGVKIRTINKTLQIIRHLLNLAASEWINDDGRPWLDHAPKIRLLSEVDKREPYPLSWEEQERLFAQLPEHYRRMALFKVNTGLRMREVCRLRWEWEVPIPELETSVFLIPNRSFVDGKVRSNVKNGEHRLVILNDIAKSVIQSVRGNHVHFVFTYHCQGRHNSLSTMNKYTWDRARNLVGLPQVRIHDLKHTFGRRLRAVGVAFEDRQDLLGHKSGRVTTHYSAAEINNLIIAANKVCLQNNSTPTLTILRTQTPTISPPSHRGKLRVIR